MTGEEFIAQLERIGVKYDSIHTKINGDEVTLRYLTYNGRSAPIDMGDLRHVTTTVVRRVCAALGLSADQRDVLTAAITRH